MCFVFKHLQGQVPEQGTDRRLARTARGDADFLLLLPASLGHTLSCLKGGKLWLRSVICIQQGVFDLKFSISHGCTVSDKFTKYPWFIKLSNIFWCSRLTFSDKRQWKNYSVTVIRAFSSALSLPTSLFYGIYLNFVHSCKA